MNQVELREIPGIPGYFAGTDGRIRSSWRGGLRRVRDDSRLKTMKSGPSCGYLRVLVREESGSKRGFLVHQLVLRAFVGPCPPGMQCCHIDGNSTNNAISNLRWDTPAANCADRDRHGTTARGEKNGFAKLTGEAVSAIRSRYAAGETQESLGKEFGVKHAAISRIVNRKAWKHVA